MSDAASADTAPRRYGKRPSPDARNKVTHERWNAAEYAALTAAAAQAGLPIGGYIRSLVLGAPGPRARRQPRTGQVELARLLGEIGKLGSNVNQIARAVNMTGNLPAWPELASIDTELQTMRDAVMKALGRGD